MILMKMLQLKAKHFLTHLVPHKKQQGILLST